MEALKQTERASVSIKTTQTTPSPFKNENTKVKDYDPRSLQKNVGVKRKNS